ncbi:TetR/AcrR family transcriptional regulator [Ktedonosporobacter rubrisoli]|uniref:TetR/AcrR family transcriptional regulator n=1 Tax=Ktedonosporobacter rubrisoli TaxID=2509675 RepID=A0A4V0YZ89_KTERU|nr:TetR family transcriptional regulator [Ktedonosporobacter rubrisoli]QBD78881.1 TetR/AcrR family transcriptional regulator [Ktedonosporobacter rubrisoli]
MEMPETGKRRSEKTRAAILAAAEAVFAEHGYDGARVDTIAEVSGYNKTLIFRYFGDKLGLYVEVLRRADSEVSALQRGVYTRLLEDESMLVEADKFRALLKTAVGTMIDYMQEHPRIMRIILWEHAEGWQTMEKIISQFEPNDIRQMEAIFARARKAGLLRPDLDVTALPLLMIQICWSYPTMLPLYQQALPERDYSSVSGRAYMREQIINFIVNGIMLDSADTAP